MGGERSMGIYKKWQMRRIDRKEYDDLMNHLQPVFKSIWEHENEERKKRGKSLDMFQFGFTINEIYKYQTGDDEEDFYIIYNTLFLTTISRQIKLAQQQYPQNFGTGNADDLIDALYNVSNYKLLGDRAAYLDHLIDIIVVMLYIERMESIMIF